MENIQRQIKRAPKGQECHLAICGEVKAGHRSRDGMNLHTREPSSTWQEQLRRQRTENTRIGTQLDKSEGDTKPYCFVQFHLNVRNSRTSVLFLNSRKVSGFLSAKYGLENIPKKLEKYCTLRK